MHHTATLDLIVFFCVVFIHHRVKLLEGTKNLPLPLIPAQDQWRLIPKLQLCYEGADHFTMVALTDLIKCKGVRNYNKRSLARTVDAEAAEWLMGAHDWSSR